MLLHVSETAHFTHLNSVQKNVHFMEMEIVQADSGSALFVLINSYRLWWKGVSQKIALWK